MNATVIMISQGAMALGGAIWGSVSVIAGASFTLLGAAALLLTSPLLARRLSINFVGNLEEWASGSLSISIEPKEEQSIARTAELLSAWINGRNIMNHDQNTNEVLDKSGILNIFASASEYYKQARKDSTDSCLPQSSARVESVELR